MIDVGRLRVGQSGINGVVAGEVHQRIVGPYLPSSAYVIANLGINALLLEIEIVTDAIRPVISHGDERRETTEAYGVGQCCLPSVVRAVLRCQRRVHTLMPCIPGNNVHHTAHGVGTI